MKALVLTVTLPVILSGLLPQMAQADTSHKAVEKAISKWKNALKHGDVTEIMDFYAQDAMLLQPSGGVSQKPAAIRSFWRSIIGSGHGDFTVDLVKLSNPDANTVIAQTKWLKTDTLDNSSQDVMHYYYDASVSTVLKKQADGSWKAQVQKWN